MNLQVLKMKGNLARNFSLWPLAAEARVRVQVSLCGICNGQSGTETGFSPRLSLFFLSVSFHVFSPYSRIELRAYVP
jgi:hypothetical protein